MPLPDRLRWRTARLVDARDETATARTLAFAVEGWAGHRAGQHVDVRLTAEDGYSAQRSYSIASAVAADLVELTVQVVDDGEVSTFLARDLALGDPVELRGPVGGWFVWDAGQGEPVLLVAGGSGVVPLMSMIRSRQAVGSRVPFRLVYSARSPAEVIYADELRRRQRDDAGLDVALLFTRRATEGSTRRPGRVTPADLAAHGWPADLSPTCYVCGPTGFVETAADLLLGLGHAAERIRTERFGG